MSKSGRLTDPKRQVHFSERKRQFVQPRPGRPWGEDETAEREARLRLPSVDELLSGADFRKRDGKRGVT